MTIFFLLTVICNHFAYVLLFLYKSGNASWYQFYTTATFANGSESIEYECHVVSAKNHLVPHCPPPS